jgi:hypothetical protein
VKLELEEQLLKYVAPSRIERQREILRQMLSETSAIEEVIKVSETEKRSTDFLGRLEGNPKS